MTEAPEPLPEPAPGPEAEAEDERRYPSTLGGACYIVILAVCAGGVAVVSGGDWRLGVRLIAGGLVAAAALRLVLPGRDAGMLAVRHRAVDVAVLGALGGLIFFLASSIPEQ